MKIIDLYLTLEKKPANESEEYTDVVITLENGERYIASFFAYGSIEVLKNKHRKTGEYLSGRYFRVENMVLVERCSEKEITDIVEDIIKEGELLSVFKLISK